MFYYPVERKHYNVTIKPKNMIPSIVAFLRIYCIVIWYLVINIFGFLMEDIKKIYVLSFCNLSYFLLDISQTYRHKYMGIETKKFETAIILLLILRFYSDSHRLLQTIPYKQFVFALLPFWCSGLKSQLKCKKGKFSELSNKN